MAERGQNVGQPWHATDGKTEALGDHGGGGAVHSALSQSQSLGRTQISGFLAGFLPPSSEVTNGQPVATSTPPPPQCAFFGLGVF